MTVSIVCNGVTTTSTAIGLSDDQALRLYPVAPIQKPVVLGATPVLKFMSSPQVPSATMIVAHGLGVTPTKTGIVVLGQVYSGGLPAGETCPMPQIQTQWLSSGATYMTLKTNNGSFSFYLDGSISSVSSTYHRLIFWAEA